MAPDHRDATGTVSYNVWLDAFDDGLESSESRPQKVRLVASDFLEWQWSETRDEIQKDWHSRRDSWRLPTAHEKDLEKWDIDHHCFWIGWFLPHLHRQYRRFVPGLCVNNYSTELLDASCVLKAFKVVYKAFGTGRNKLFALYSPDKNGVSRAVSVPGGVCSVFFFEEWRDDTLTGRTARQRSWLRKVMSISTEEDFPADASSDGDESENIHSDGDMSEYIYSGSESSESESEDISESSRSGAKLQIFDDEAEHKSEEEHMDRNINDADVIRLAFSAQEFSFAPLRSRPPTRRGASKILKGPLPQFKDYSPQPRLTNNADAYSAEPGVRSKTHRKVRATPADTKASGTQAKKRQIGQYSELRSRPKRSRPSRQDLRALLKVENRDLNDEGLVKFEKTHDSNDEVQFVGEVSLTTSRKNTAAAASVTPSPTESATFILDFIAADKLSKVARLQDAFSRRVTLKAFRRHLATTPEAESDALVHNIAENEDEDTRIMLAEALVADLKEKMDGVRWSTTRVKSTPYQTAGYD